MSLIWCIIITLLSLASMDKKRVKERVYQRFQEREFTKRIGSESVNHMSLITCHSFHVTHLMSYHYVTHLISLISFVDFMWLILCIGLMSLITCHSSHLTHLMSHHYVTHLMSLISCLDLMSLISCLDLMSHITCHWSLFTHHMSLISCLITRSLISCLIIMSLIGSYCLYTLSWPHLTSAHDLCQLVTA